MTDSVTIDVSVCVDSKTLEQKDCDDEKSSNKRESQFNNSDRGRDEYSTSRNKKQKKENKISKGNKSEKGKNDDRSKTTLVKQPINIPTPGHLDDAITSYGFILAGKVDTILVSPLKVPGSTLAAVDFIHRHNPNEIIITLNQSLLKSPTGDCKMNMTGVTLGKYLLDTAKSKDKNEFREAYDVANTIVDSYKNLYEKSLDANLSAKYQVLAKNFTYSSKRVEKAKRRFTQFMDGKRFKLSEKDQKIMADLSMLENQQKFNMKLSQFYTAAKKLGYLNHLVSAWDLAQAFNQAQKTKNWQGFWSKVTEMGASMLIGSITTLAMTGVSIPMALVAVILGIAASHFFDDVFWNQFINDLKIYF